MDLGENAALRDLIPQLRQQFDPASADWLRNLGAARARLTPEETYLPIDASGSESDPPPAVAPGEAPLHDADVTIDLSQSVALVLHEFTYREIDERKGANLLGAFVGAAEFWALNSLQCLLERETPFLAAGDYADQVRAARRAVSADPAALSGAPKIAGTESPAMTNGPK